MKKLILLLLFINSILFAAYAQVPDPCTGTGAAQAISTLSPCNCSEANITGGTPCNKSSFATKALSDAAINTFITTQSTYVLPTVPTTWQDVRPQALLVNGAYKHEFCTEVTTAAGTNKLNILNIAQVQINCDAVCQDYKIIQKTGTCGTNTITPTLVASALNPTVKYRQYAVLPNTTYIICRQLYFDGSDLDCYTTFVGGDGLNSGGAQVTAQHWFYYEEAIVTPLYLTAFNGINANNQNLLQWSVTNNAAIATFLLEKSTDGITFTPIKTINENPTSTSYTYTDVNTVTVPQTFYRLKIVDKNGSYYYSTIIKIKTTNNENDWNITQSINNISVTTHQTKAMPVTISLWQTNGKLISTVSKKVEAGFNTFQVPTIGVAKGIYFIKINTAEYANTKKIMIL